MAKTTKTATPPTPQPPYLKHVRLRNAPPLRDVQVDFRSGLNIIIGKNGSGKTQFLNLLGELGDLSEGKYRGIGCELVLGGIKDVKIAFKKHPPASDDAKKSPVRVSGNQLPLIVVVSNGKQTSAGEALDAALNNVLSENASYELIRVRHGIPVHRMIMIDEGTDLSFNDSGGMWMMNPQEHSWQQAGVLERALLDSMVPYDVGSPANQFTKIDLGVIRKFIVARLNFHLDRINHYLPIYSPLQAVRLGAQFQVYHNTTSDEIIIKGLALEYCIGNDWLPFSALSDGTKRIFYVVGELMTNSTVWWNTEDSAPEPEKIILLEEPELGIHPQQLHLLLQLIREVSKEHQVILTTHSPQVLDILTEKELDRITICEFIPGEGTKMRKLSAAKKAKAKFYLKDDGALSEFWRFSNLEDPD